ncbi:MAG TPA: hypothetical protein DCQ30_12500, partial [Acidimicrobiaceae bacterium]|nr:hypothetical protein [Acidimicrobiaceae bacterium]
MRRRPACSPVTRRRRPPGRGQGRNHVLSAATIVPCRPATGRPARGHRQRVAGNGSPASSGAKFVASCLPHPCRVLLVSKVRAGGHRYYLDATSGPGGRGTEPPGSWLGKAARRMDMGAPVGLVALEALMEGSDPRTGELLGADRRLVTVAAFDMTFCAPKSVSLLHALGPDEVRCAVEEGHERAVTAALCYVEDRALAVRRSVPGVRRAVPVAVDTLPAAAFVHRTSRALDPHLHSHVLVANVGTGPDGSASALDGRGVYAHRATAAALYHAQLRHELTTALGVAWEPLDRGRADVAGIGPEARREFSRRSAAIAADLA